MAGTVCIVQIVNECKPEWNVNIVAVGCKFFFSDGTDYQDGPIQVNVPSGGDTSLRTNDPTKCVVKVLITITAQEAGSPPQNYAKEKDPPPGFQCLEEFQAKFGAIASSMSEPSSSHKNADVAVRHARLGISVESVPPKSIQGPSRHIPRGSLKALEGPIRLSSHGPKILADEHPYDVYIVNTCNWNIYSIIAENGQEFPINPPIGRTCPAGSSYDNCKNNGDYQRLTTSDCTAAPYRYKIRAVHPATGKKGETGWQTVEPDCRYPGEVGQFDEPDPEPSSAF